MTLEEFWDYLEFGIAKDRSTARMLFLNSTEFLHAFFEKVHRKKGALRTAVFRSSKSNNAELDIPPPSIADLAKLSK